MFGEDPLWRGVLRLPAQSVPVNLHFVSGNRDLPDVCFPRGRDPVISPRTLQIPKNRKMKIRKDTMYYDHHTILIGLPADGTGNYESYIRAQRLYHYCHNLKGLNKVAIISLEHEGEDKFCLYAFPQGHTLAATLIDRLLPEEAAQVQDRAWLMFVLTRDHPDLLPMLGTN